MRNKIFAFALLAAVSFSAESFGQQYYLKETVVKNIDRLTYRMSWEHPSLFLYHSKQELDDAVRKLKAELPDSLTVYGMYGYLLPVFGMLNDMHSVIMPPVEAYYEVNPYMLAASPYIDRKDFTLKLAAPDFRDAEILSINGCSNKEITERLMSFASAETQLGRAVLANKLMSMWFPLVDSTGTYVIEYIASGEKKTTVLKGVRAKDLTTSQTKTDQSDVVAYGPAFTFCHVAPSTVLLKMPSFDAVKATPVIDSMFSYLSVNRNVSNLVIDLRNNPGGYAGVMNRLLRYLSSEPFKYGDLAEVKNKEKNYKVSLWFNRLKKVKPEPYERRFHGDTYVLVDNNSGSSSVLLAYAVQKYGIGTIVGEETANAIFTHTIGSWFTLDGGLKVYMSTVVVYQPHKKRIMHGVIPDIEVPSAQALDKVLEIIGTFETR